MLGHCLHRRCHAAHDSSPHDDPAAQLPFALANRSPGGLTRAALNPTLCPLPPLLDCPLVRPGVPRPAVSRRATRFARGDIQVAGGRVAGEAPPPPPAENALCDSLATFHEYYELVMFIIYCYVYDYCFMQRGLSHALNALHSRWPYDLTPLVVLASVTGS